MLLGDTARERNVRQGTGGECTLRRGERREGREGKHCSRTYCDVSILQIEGEGRRHCSRTVNYFNVSVQCAATKQREGRGERAGGIVVELSIILM